jgi:hypothetical protein
MLRTRFVEDSVARAAALVARLPAGETMAVRTSRFADILKYAFLLAAGCGGKSNDHVIVVVLNGAGDAQASDASGDAPNAADGSPDSDGQPVADATGDGRNAGDAANGSPAVGDEPDEGLICPTGVTLCGGRCVETDSDPENCGACGQACSPGTVCSGGGCIVVCLGGSTLCGVACVDTRDDPSNCGSCGARCAVGMVCVNAACTGLGGGPSPPDASVACAAGLSACDGACQDLSSNDANCGQCGLPCTSGQVCSLGVCACPEAALDCNGSCIDVTTDANNCGACGAACGSFEVCVAGSCVCAPTAMACGSACRDTAIDMANCGACAATCTPGNECTGGACTTATADWPTLGHDPQHTGQNGDETGTPPMVDSWKAVVVPGGNALSSPVVENGRVFVTSQTYFGSSVPLTALNVADGSALWTYNFGSLSSIGFPAVSNGAVYVQTIDETERAFLWSIGAASGSVTWSAAFATQWAALWAPTVVGSTVFVDGGEYGGLYAFAVGDGSEVFANTQIGQYDSWSPAYFNGNIYTFVAGTFQASDPSTGTAVWSTSTTWNWDGYSMDTSPVFGANLAYVIAPPNLVAIDPVREVVTWTANGTYTGTPAVSGSLVFGISAGNLIARDAASGTLQWTFVGDTSLSYPPVIANGYAYVASANNVYAVRLADHTQAWTAPVGGWLAVAAGRLLVAGTNGTLYGFVLTP